MKVKPAAVDRTRKFRVLGEKPVTRMNRFGVRLFCRSNDGVDLQVTLTGRSWPNADGFVSHAHVQTLSVGFGIDRDRLNAQSRQVRIIRTAISPRLAIRTLRNMFSESLSFDALCFVDF